MEIKLVYRINYKFLLENRFKILRNEEVSSVDLDKKPSIEKVKEFVAECNKLYNIKQGEIVIQEIYLTWT